MRSHTRERTTTVSLHGLTSITVGVPDVEATCGYYAEFGLEPSQHSADGTRHTFATVDGGEQLNIEPPRSGGCSSCLGRRLPRRSRPDRGQPGRIGCRIQPHR